MGWSLTTLPRFECNFLPVVENWNSANDFILYGKGGEFASNKREDQEVGMLALHLLQISLVYINTLMIQQVLAEPTWHGRLTPTDLRALTPLKWLHANPYGTFTLNMHARLPHMTMPFNERTWMCYHQALP